MPTPADNTTIGAAATAGDVISTEDMPVFGFRGIDTLPVTDYKLPRSKIAIGRYGVDQGDVTPSSPLPVQSMIERRLHEEASVRGIEAMFFPMQSRSFERLPLLDRRGNTTRGVR